MEFSGPTPTSPVDFVYIIATGSDHSVLSEWWEKWSDQCQLFTFDVHNTIIAIISAL